MNNSETSSTKERYYGMSIAYYGTDFIGWQRQPVASKPGFFSVQQIIEDSLSRALSESKRVNVNAVSRTDAGTHAVAQFASFRFLILDTCMIALLEKLNRELPSTIRVLRLAPLEEFVDDFTHIRPRYKRYVYYIQQGARPDLELCKYSWFLRKRIEPARMQQALNFLLGTRDFEPFSQGLGMVSEGKSTTRTLHQCKAASRNVNFCLDPAVCGSGDTVNNQADLCDMEGKIKTHFICIELVANGFLRHMVRRIVGSLRRIGEGSQHPQEMQRILESQVEAGPSAPAKGLWLQAIWFTDMKEIASSTLGHENKANANLSIL